MLDSYQATHGKPWTHCVRESNDHLLAAGACTAVAWSKSKGPSPCGEGPLVFCLEKRCLGHRPHGRNQLRWRQLTEVACNALLANQWKRDLESVSIALSPDRIGKLVIAVLLPGGKQVITSDNC